MMQMTAAEMKAVPRRILYVIDSLNIGGAEMLLLDLVDAARAKGAQTHVAYFTPGPLEEELRQRGVGTTRLSSQGLRDPRALPRAVSLMRKWRPDVVHSHLVKSDLIGQMAARMTRTPLRLLTLHNTDPWRRKKLFSFLYRMATTGAHERIAVSEAIGKFAEVYGSVPPASVQVIDNGVDVRRFDPESVTPLDLGALGVPEGTTTCAVVGRLTEQKDHNTFLRAAAMLVDKCPGLYFLIVGDGELRAELEAKVVELGLPGDRVLFTGIIRDVPGLMAALDIVAFSSAWEGLPMVLIEAMMMARPVAATAVGAIPSVIDEDQDGLLVPAKDPAALADAISRLATDVPLRHRLGAAAREKVQARFSSHAMSEKLFSIYASGMQEQI